MGISFDYYSNIYAYVSQGFFGGGDIKKRLMLLCISHKNVSHGALSVSGNRETELILSVP